MAIPTSYENVTYNSPDGAVFGSASTKKIGFYGTTPVTQITVTAVTAGGTTTAAKVTIAGVYNALVTLGLIA